MQIDLRLCVVALAGILFSVAASGQERPRQRTSGVVAEAASSASTLPAHLPPEVLLDIVGAKVILLFKRNQELQLDASKSAEGIYSSLLPLFDFSQMTRSVVAANWRLANAEQRQTLTAEFQTLLIRTYARLLWTYQDQAIQFQPTRLSKGQTDVTVRSSTQAVSRGKTRIDYDMEKSEAGWKIVDIKVDGVSMVSFYRDVFTNKVREGGVNDLIHSLAQNNRQNEPSYPGRYSVLERHFYSMIAVVLGLLQKGE